MMDAGDTLLGTVIRSAPPLAAGALYDGTLTVSLPSNAAGLRHVLVRTDALGEVYEKGLTGNNVGATATPITLQSPDLTVAAITVPPAAQPGQLRTVTWEVPNGGFGDAIGGWTDRVVLVRAGSADIVLAHVGRGGGLAAGDSYTGTANFYMPVVAGGDWRIRIDADYTGQMFEAGADGNNSTTSTGAIAVTHPDVAITKIQAFRAARPSVGLARDLERTVITTFGRDFATANTLFHRGGRLGRQSQSWARLPGLGWQVVAAHVSVMPPT